MDAGFKLNSKQTEPIIPSLINQMVFTKVVHLTSEKQIDSVISSGLIVTPKHSFYILKIASEHYLQDQLRYEKDYFLKFKDVVYKEKNNVNHSETRQKERILSFGVVIFRFSLVYP